jgi:hypothetical protein
VVYFYSGVDKRCRQLAEDMRTLVQTLPYDWLPPPVDEHDILTALAVFARTGEMPPAPPH